MTTPDNKCLVIDIGNSATKAFHFTTAGQLLATPLRAPVEDAARALAEWSAHLPAQAVYIASTGHAPVVDAIAAQFKETGRTVLRLEREGALPFDSDYAAGQAGIDRLANIAAISALNAAPAIVVDAGTAITIDLASSTGRYLGGWILPGLRLQMNALYRGTRDLPQLTDRATRWDFGTPHETDLAIRNGVALGLIGAIRHLVDHARALPDTFRASLFFTGGDGEFFHSQGHFRHSHYHDHLTGLGILHLARARFPAQF